MYDGFFSSFPQCFLDIFFLLTTSPIHQSSAFPFFFNISFFVSSGSMSYHLERVSWWWVAFGLLPIWVFIFLFKLCLGLFIWWFSLEGWVGMAMISSLFLFLSSSIPSFFNSLSLLALRGNDLLLCALCNNGLYSGVRPHDVASLL